LLAGQKRKFQSSTGVIAVAIKLRQWQSRRTFMGFEKLFYKFAARVREGSLGEILAKAWHKLAPPINIWKRIYGLDMCLDLRDGLIWWAMDPNQIRENEGFHRMLAGIKGNVWDVGCNIGVFSLYAASQGNNVVAFDISPKAVALLEKSAERNHLPVKTVTRAFSVSTFRYSAPTDADTRNRPGDATANAAESSITYLEAEKQFGTPRFIKLDIEYGEVAFLRSDEFKHWIKTHGISLLVELHESEYWNLVWPDVPHIVFDESHALFYPYR
jgi:FkbM family methyltransferase